MKSVDEILAEINTRIDACELVKMKYGLEHSVVIAGISRELQTLRNWIELKVESPYTTSPQPERPDEK